MGELAEYILNGDDCQECGQYIGDGDGFPRSCSDCQPQPKQRKRKRRKKRKMKNFDDDIIDFINAALAAERAGQIADDATATMPMQMFLRMAKQAHGYQTAALEYQAFHETEKAMRRFAEEDLGKFRKLIGRLFWQRGARHD